MATRLCASCGYDVSSIADERGLAHCPECGESGPTVVAAPRMPVWRWLLPGTVAVLPVLPGLVAYSRGVDGWDQLHAAFVLVPTGVALGSIIGTAFSLLMYKWLAKRPNESTRPVLWAPFLLAALVATGSAVTVGFCGVLVLMTTLGLKNGC